MILPGGREGGRLGGMVKVTVYRWKQSAGEDERTALVLPRGATFHVKQIGESQILYVLDTGGSEIAAFAEWACVEVDPEG